MARIIVEQVFEGEMPDEAQTKKLDDCLEAEGAAWRRSYTSKDGKRMTCEFDARSVEGVKKAYADAGLSYVSAWEAELEEVDDYPEQYDRLERVLANRREAAGSVH